ncbi:MAG: hypothetical protein EBY40_04710 [Marivivens sp.]|nr:hypothetical protein [Marivivens sp.]NBT51262.1 hypothetical protein [Marivivens sp.]NDH02415.1 hypothetical protein [Marivivens sp.]
MADPKDDDQKEGISMADIVKALVLAWSAALLTASYLGIFPQMKMDNTFVASLLTGAMASFGIERKTNGNGNKKPTIVDNKDTKAGIK